MHEHHHIPGEMAGAGMEVVGGGGGGGGGGGIGTHRHCEGAQSAEGPVSLFDYVVRALELAASGREYQYATRTRPNAALLTVHVSLCC